VAKSKVLALLTFCLVPCANAGAWGYGSFENDDALDWVLELERASGPQFLQTTLQHVDTGTKYVEAPTCAIALAAAEVIAAAIGRPPKALPSEVAAWIKRVRPTMSPMLLAAARAAVQKCRGPKNSELRELWQESKDEKAWLDDTASLLARLKSAVV
jgi:hypothetical protein